jgi:hypothetical protein
VRPGRERGTPNAEGELPVQSKRAGRDGPLAVADLILGGSLALLSAWVIASAIRMPRPGGWAEAPGLFPLVCGAALLGMAVFLVVTTLAGRHPDAGRESAEGDGDPGTPELRRTLLVVGSVLVYALVLIPLLHYTVATVVYLVAVIWYFWRGNLVWILAIALSGALFLSQTFEHMFAIILP